MENHQNLLERHLIKTSDTKVHPPIIAGEVNNILMWQYIDLL